MCLMQAKGNKAVANSGYENFSNFSMTFVKYFMKKQHF